MEMALKRTEMALKGPEMALKGPEMSLLGLRVDYFIYSLGLTSFSNLDKQLPKKVKLLKFQNII